MSPTNAKKRANPSSVEPSSKVVTLAREISDVERYAFQQASKARKEMLPSLEVALETSQSLSDQHMKKCLDLLAQTSAAAYRASSKGWSPKQKREEMKQDGMRYILLLDKMSKSKTTTRVEKCGAFDGHALVGFISYMLTVEDNHKALYIYEVHLSEKLRGRGIGQMLMTMVTEIASEVGMQLTMLTVFTSNEGALRFYKRLGYQMWDEEPLLTKRKKLRSGTKEIKPSYAILAKKVKGK